MLRPIIGILLAAGRGSRFGSNKLLHRLPNAQPMAVAAARNLRPACDRMIAVIRPDSARLADLLVAEGCETWICQDADGGMGNSLATGVIASPEAAGWVVALGDMPFILTSSHQSVVASLRAGARLAAPVFDGKRGHPVGFSEHWFDQLSRLTGDQGGRHILESHREALCLCSVDDAGVLRDIDRPDDLK